MKSFKLFKFTAITLIVLSIISCSSENRSGYEYEADVYLTQCFIEDMYEAQSCVKTNGYLRKYKLYVNSEGHFYIPIELELKSGKVFEIELDWLGSGLTQVSKFIINDDVEIKDIEHIETKVFETVAGTNQVRHTYFSESQETYFVFLIDYRDFIKF